MLDIGSVTVMDTVFLFVFFLLFFLRVRSVSDDYVTTADVLVLNNVLNKYLQLADTVVFRPTVLVGWA